MPLWPSCARVAVLSWTEPGCPAGVARRVGVRGMEGVSHGRRPGDASVVDRGGGVWAGAVRGGYWGGIRVL